MSVSTVRVVQSSGSSYWYSDFVGCDFDVELISAKFRNHAYRPKVYEVISGPMEGCVLLQGDVEVVQ